MVVVVFLNVTKSWSFLYMKYQLNIFFIYPLFNSITFSSKAVTFIHFSYKQIYVKY